MRGAVHERPTDSDDGVSTIDRHSSITEEIARRNDIGVDSVGDVKQDYGILLVIRRRTKRLGKCVGDRERGV